MGYQVVWQAVAVTKEGDTQDTIVRQGDLLPDWVSDFTKFVLTNTGAVKLVETPDPGLQARANPPEPVLLQEHAPYLTAGAQERFDAEQAAAEPPPPSALKDDWVSYAVSRGMAREDAEAATKQQLVDLYG